MKKIAIIIGAVFIIALSAFISKKNFASGIHGIVTPADAVVRVWAINGKDSVAVAPVSGNFSVDIKPGNCRLHIEAAKGYKDVFVNNIIVEEGSYADAGDIKLSN